MVLCMDAGNSSVKFCTFDRKGRRSRVHSETICRQQVSWDSMLKSVLRGHPPLRGAILSSVVPELTPALTGAIRRAGGLHPLLVNADLHFPFRIGVPHPGTVGTDRLCCAAGAIGVRRTSAVLIDIGSAVTVDLVLEAVFKGGIILPGPDLSLRALAHYTAKLPLVEFRPASAARSKRFDSTENSLRLGARLSTQGGVREAVRYLDRAAGQSVVKILTGGAAAAFSRSLPKSWRRDPHLVMSGLYRIWQLNTPGEFRAKAIRSMI